MIKLGLLASTVMASVVGSYFFKKSAEEAGYPELFFAFGIMAWIVSAVGFVALLRMGPLLIYGPLAAVIQVSAMMVVSVLFLNESFSAGQWVAASISVAAMGVTLALAP